MHFSPRVIERFGDVPMQDAMTEEDLQRELMLNISAYGLPRGHTARVAVIGAGMSGLVAALELKRVGYNVTIYESSQRVGGRAKSADGIFTPGLTAELGAMRFPSPHFLTHAYIHKLGLQIRPFHTYNPNSLYFLEEMGYPFPKGAIATNDTLVQEMCDLFSITDPNERLWAGTHFDKTVYPLVAQLHADGNWTRINEQLDGVSLREYLVLQGWSEGAIEFYMLTQNSETIQNFDFLEIFRDYVGQWFNDNSMYPYPSSGGIYAGLPDHGLWEIVGGTSMFPNAFLPLLEDSLVFGAQVTAIDYSSADEVRVTYSVRDVRVAIESFDYVIVTIPFSLLRHVGITPPFSHEKRKAMREVHYMQSTKVLLQYRERFWERPNPLVPPQFHHPGIEVGSGGGTYTDLPLRTLFYPAHPDAYSFNTSRGVLLASYSWEDEAGTWGSLSPEFRVRSAQRLVAKIHGPDADKYFETGTSEVWSTDVFAGGAFVYFQPGHQRRLYPGIVQSEGNGLVYFAGEHASLSHSWIQGSLWSSMRAISELHQHNQHRHRTHTLRTKKF